MTTKVQTPKNSVAEYNDDAEKALMKALTMGSMKRPRATLADLAGLAVNDNNSTKGE